MNHHNDTKDAQKIPPLRNGVSAIICISELKSFHYFFVILCCKNPRVNIFCSYDVSKAMTRARIDNRFRLQTPFLYRPIFYLSKMFLS